MAVKNENTCVLTQLEQSIILPLLKERYNNVNEYSVEYHELGHLIEKIENNLK